MIRAGLVEFFTYHVERGDFTNTASEVQRVFGSVPTHELSTAIAMAAQTRSSAAKRDLGELGPADRRRIAAILKRELA